MFGHDLNKLIVRKVLACHVFPIGDHFGAQSILGSQPGLLQ